MSHSFTVGASFKPLQNEAGSTTASTVQTTTESGVNHPDPESNHQSAATTTAGSSGGDQDKTDTETSTNSSPVKSTASKAAAFLSAKMSSTESKKSAKSPEDCKSTIYHQFNFVSQDENFLFLNFHAKKCLGSFFNCFEFE